jgi:hypothetical protein
MEAAHDLGRDRELATPFHIDVQVTLFTGTDETSSATQPEKKTRTWQRQGRPFITGAAIPRLFLTIKHLKAFPVIRKLLIAAWRRWSRSLIAWPSPPAIQAKNMLAGSPSTALPMAAQSQQQTLQAAIKWVRSVPADTPVNAVGCQHRR